MSTAILCILIMRTPFPSETSGPFLFILAGVVFTSFSQQGHFRWVSLVVTAAANIVFSTRNVLAKLGPKSEEHRMHELDSQYMFSLYSLGGLLAMIPFSLIAILSTYLFNSADSTTIYDSLGIPILPQTTTFSDYWDGTGLLLLLATGTSHALYNIASFEVLSRVSPVAHSLGNCMKRIFVIISSMLLFHESLSPSKVCGCLLALFGISWYTYKQEMHKDSRSEASSALSSPPASYSTHKINSILTLLVITTFLTCSFLASDYASKIKMYPLGNDSK